MSVEKSEEKQRILVVDDTKSDRDLFKYLLDRSGFEVEVASGGVQAIVMLEEKDFDLVLCDYLMPSPDGYEFLRKVRQDARLSHMIIIIITSDESDETKAKLLGGGANDFVRKGDSHDEIVARIRVHLNAQAAKADRKVLEITCELADKISQPLSVLIAGLDLLDEKIKTELRDDQKKDFQGLVGTVNKEADALIVITQELKTICMKAHKH